MNHNLDEHHFSVPRLLLSPSRAPPEHRMPSEISEERNSTGGNFPTCFDNIFSASRRIFVINPARCAY